MHPQPELVLVINIMIGPANWQKDFNCEEDSEPLETRKTL